MLILGIESSCDETAASVVLDGRDVKSSIIASQIAIHQLFGGVVPEIAAREHLKVIDKIVQEALSEAGITADAVSAIAVTQGPGLIGSLLVGVAYAKGLALALNKPLIPVDHVHAHVHGALLGVSAPAEEIFPCFALVVSGGHTNLYYMKDPLSFSLLAFTVDDACGESFDKVAKLMHLGYPGGPAIEKLARNGNASLVKMPRMVPEKKRLEFSYSGLKTHMVNLLHREKVSADSQRAADICAAFQEEALDQIVRKLETAQTLYPQAKSVLIAGGVAANQRFRSLLAERLPLKGYFPQLSYCSDNAAMIAAYGYHKAQAAKGSLEQNLSWDAYSRYAYQDVLAT